MPLYTYRREDGTEFDIRQKFSDDPLEIDPETGQKVIRVIQPAGIVFKGSGFYVNDSKGSKKSNVSSNGASDNGNSAAASTSNDDSTPAKTETKSEAKTETKTTKTETKAKSD